jgi:hypothetical protein
VEVTTLKFTPLTDSRENPDFIVMRYDRYFNGLEKNIFTRIIEMPLKTNTQTKNSKKLMATTI